MVQYRDGGRGEDWHASPKGSRAAHAARWALGGPVAGGLRATARLPVLDALGADLIDLGGRRAAMRWTPQENPLGDL